jgi:hypothetical protein
MEDLPPLMEKYGPGAIRDWCDVRMVPDLCHCDDGTPDADGRAWQTYHLKSISRRDVT